MNKFFKWGCLGALGLVLLMIIIGAGASSNKQSDSQKDKETTNIPVMNDETKQSDNTTSDATVSMPTLVDAKQFVSEFDKNQLAAEEKYKDKSVKFSAYIKNISEDILGSPFLSLEPTNDKYYFGTTIQCIFGNKSELTHVENGQKVTLVGTVESQDLGIIRIKSCKIEN